MKVVKLILCLLVVSLFAFAQQRPEPFSKEVQKSDQEVFQKETSKSKKRTIRR